MSTARQHETEMNYSAFMKQLPGILENFAGKFALLHSQKIEDYFDSPADAVIEGAKRFGQGAYSVQEVTDEIESLGFYSYAGGKVQA